MQHGLAVLRGGSLIRIWRREESDWLGVAVSTAVGLGLGVLAGMAVNELVGGLNPARLKRVVHRARPGKEEERSLDAAALEHAVRGALSEHPTTRSMRIDVRALGDGIVELTGTAADAEGRGLAAAVARGVSGTHVIVNRLLVEDSDGANDRRASATRD
jgi:osmotically-inducible protein OsmY